MRKEGLMVVVILLFFSVGVWGQTSSETDTVIEIIGCSDDFEFAKIGDCLDNAYCASHNNLLDSFTVPGACTKFQASVSVNVNDICCELKNNICKDEGGGYLCVPRVKDCVDYTGSGSAADKDACLTNQCYWDDNKAICIPFSRGCYDYTNPLLCEGDPQDVAKNDPNCKYGEVNVQGYPFVVSRDTCECVWGPSSGSAEGDTCKLRSNVTAAYGDGELYSLCTFELETTEQCDDGDKGFEKYKYIATYDYEMGVTGAVQSDFGCANRTGQRRCGVPVVKVPFFDFVNVILVVLFIFMIYSVKAKTKFSFWYK